ncbi:ribosome biogenesis GTPase / thiamine phosphate phosphatase [Cytobacillus horneckiae]|uniref:Small ribosomal subunit biogenesis GTPase RsgA n=1 Tax=Cytobacillus horneckiae TaxID=549687 RepID=A0A2N0ZM56_9BACI|nr:ribosome small subunit-dependent GTPase A [Cytobacillus horneckiae]NRG45637.1 ribosome small subunit-dependent GTPase A [Bacillus sp. CRN 9]MBN6887112.1 ribosome small subunit-dependent GTPase A [Cytobacillus horneckiae]MCM3178298.1 ribosome small subunit-dependent GTPase A [Cytobacillus horneckiae]MEC1156963.1 ribosome small subunit-dependent GTPase A [Cytobacillus horneckiae]MED2940011.1 ribosome small subunit-dependent GTPase A [Cytobacillus horneckiae]
MPEGKIIKALSGFYYVLSDEEEIIQCRGRGVFRKNKITPLVGDEVVYQAENDKEGYILEVKERKNELIRPPIANVDQAFLVFSSVEPAFSTALLDRFLVLVEFNSIKPIICITKMDLADEAQQETIRGYADDYRKAGYEVLLTSSETEEGINELAPFIRGEISVFAGQSGVGKSSLLNVLRPDLELKTDDISTHLGRGKHTTRHVELIEINDGYVADTPGFSSLEFTHIEMEDLNGCFPDIQEKSEECKFRGCLHLKEPKCTVKEAYDSGEIPAYRYEHYIAFLQEIKERKPRY